MPERYVYADNAATTKVSQTALEAMLPYLTQNYANPSAIYKSAREAAGALLRARETCAKALGAKRAGEIYFTSCGTESDNWALRGGAQLGAALGKRHIITTAIEHPAVLRTCEYLEDQGFEVTYLPVSNDGFVTCEQVAAAIRQDTALVSVMFANNEIGTIQPIEEIGAVCHEKGVLFHTDAVQAVGNIKIDVQELGIDMLSLSGHKIHAPKGIGLLYCRGNIALPSLIFGGSQERGRRAGTENVAYISALAAVLEEAVRTIDERRERVLALRRRLTQGLLEIDKTCLNGSEENRLAGNANISFPGLEGESLLLALDMQGIAASSGSACSSGSLEASHVLKAIGRSDEMANSAVRFTLNEDNTEEEIDYILKTVPQVVDRLRSMSPYWQRIVNEESTK